MATETTVAQRLRVAASNTCLDQADIAMLVGATKRTVVRWLAGESEPSAEVRRRLFDVLAVLNRLSEVLSPQAAREWLFSPNPALGHDTPIKLMTSGERQRVLGVIDALAEGIFV